jgi:hypothetical protein
MAALQARPPLHTAAVKAALTFDGAQKTLANVHHLCRKPDKRLRTQRPVSGIARKQELESVLPLGKVGRASLTTQDLVGRVKESKGSMKGGGSSDPSSSLFRAVLNQCVHRHFGILSICGAQIVEREVLIPQLKAIESTCFS